MPPLEPLTAMGMHVLGALIGTVIGWVFVSLGYGSILGLIAMALSGYSATPSAFIMSFFGSKMMASMTGVLIFIALLSSNKLENYIVAKLFGMKFVRDHPYALFSLLVASVYIVTVLSGATTASLFVILPIFYNIFEQAGFQKGSKQAAAIFMIYLVAAAPAMTNFPFLGVGIIMMNAMEATGAKITAIDYVSYTIPMTIAILASYVFYCRFIWRADMSALAKVNIDLGNVRLEKRQKATLILFIISLLSMLICGTGLPIVGKLESTGALYLCILAGIIINVDGRPIIDFKQLAPHFDWPFFSFWVLLVQPPAV